MALRDSLSPQIAKVYDGIARERRDHYLQGLTLGGVASFIALQAMKVENAFHRMAVFFSLTLFIGVLYYSLMPKSDYMLRHLTTADQQEKWLEIYLTMKSRYIAGFVLGAVAALPVSFAMCGVSSTA